MQCEEEQGREELTEKQTEIQRKEKKAKRITAQNLKLKTQITNERFVFHN